MSTFGDIDGMYQYSSGVLEVTTACGNFLRQVLDVWRQRGRSSELELQSLSQYC